MEGFAGVLFASDAEQKLAIRSRAAQQGYQDLSKIASNLVSEQVYSPPVVFAAACDYLSYLSPPVSLAHLISPTPSSSSSSTPTHPLTKRLEALSTCKNRTNIVRKLCLKHLIHDAVNALDPEGHVVELPRQRSLSRLLYSRFSICDGENPNSFTVTYIQELSLAVARCAVKWTTEDIVYGLDFQPRDGAGEKKWSVGYLNAQPPGSLMRLDDIQLSVLIHNH